MTEQSKHDIIRKSPLASELTVEESEALSNIITVRTLKNDEFLIKEGETDSCLYMVAQGALAVVKSTGLGDWITLHVLKEGDLAGELGFVDNREHTASLRAIGEAQIFALERQDFESLLENHPRIVYHVMRAIIRAVHDILRRMNTQHAELTNYITKSHGRY